MKPEDPIELVREKLKWLRLPGMAGALHAVLEQAGRDNLTACEVVSRLCDEEKSSRLKSAIAAKVKGARFPEINTIDGFDFDFDAVRKKLKSRYLALHDVTFLDKGINPLFIGLPGTGKTYLARALAWRVCQANRRLVLASAARMLNELHGAEFHGGLERVLRRYVRADLLVIDDFAVLAMDAAHAKLAFQVISERYDMRRSTCITTIFDKLASAISLAECLNSLVVSLLDDRAVLTLEDMVSLGKIGGNVVKQIRALEKILLGWVGPNDL